MKKGDIKASVDDDLDGNIGYNKKKFGVVDTHNETEILFCQIEKAHKDYVKKSRIFHQEK